MKSQQGQAEASHTVQEEAEKVAHLSIVYAWFIYTSCTV